MASLNSPRDLNGLERDVLTFILTADFAGAKELRAQIPYVRVIGQGYEGSPHDPDLDIEVSPEVPASPIKDGPIPVGCNVHNDNNEYEGEILVWVKGGYLSAMEYAWVSLKPHVSGEVEERPTTLPRVTNLTLI